jgi:hypothetical protein
MSNEEVVLNMVINRLKQLLEANESLRSVWSAEITEIILLGQGVLVATPESKTADGRWILALSGDELDMLSNMFWQDSMDRRDFGREIWEPMGRRIGVLFEEMAREAQDETLDDDPDDDPDDGDDDDPIDDDPIAPEPYVINVGEALGEGAQEPQPYWRAFLDYANQPLIPFQPPPAGIFEPAPEAVPGNHTPEMPNEQG